MLTKIKPDFEFADERGIIVQLVHEGYKQFNIITSKKGSIRGKGHYHKLNREAFYIISGKIEVTVNEEIFAFEAGEFFEIEPYDRHSFCYIEDTVLVSMYERGGRIGEWRNGYL